MILTLQIAVGLWLGGLCLVGTAAGFFWIAERIAKNRRFGAPWHHGILTARRW